MARAGETTRRRRTSSLWTALGGCSGATATAARSWGWRTTRGSAWRPMVEPQISYNKLVTLAGSRSANKYCRVARFLQGDSSAVGLTLIWVFHHHAQLQLHSSLLPNSHQPKLNWADGGTQLKSKSTQPRSQSR